jgi:hypothetical protein
VCTAAALQRYELALAKLQQQQQQQQQHSRKKRRRNSSSGSYGVCILPLKLATAPPFDSPQQSTRRARARAPSAFGRRPF